MAENCEVLFIGGRSGVGKSSVAFEMHHQLSQQEIKHAVIEGDNLDLAFPVPWEHRLAERNLRVQWSNYLELGYQRLIYTNTVSVLETDVLAEAMGGTPRVTGVLLTAGDDTVSARLAQRTSGAELLAEELVRSSAASQQLASRVPSWVHRIDTDGRKTAEIAAEILQLLDWH
ncbi:adenylyl-sulfate kinase [Psychromicrobium lacuslunae]|uniref:APS kinase domain-containing protein n=1 Tax=Psychromicrobium lacuslunae TaxID=1618207 RepID=A0A0D4C081_9MICC|nr:adenylyl-sulfate kinase [Psychromicrobium lacuslunae]AJT41815.1 hypothetical protein UM93_10345 [Psychromicrobium lacuslunae]